MNKEKPTGAFKQHIGKLPFHHIPVRSLHKLLTVYQHGCHKYAENDYRLGIKFSVYYDAAMRHLLAWWAGEPYNPESGLSHLSHAAWCIMTLLEYEDVHPHLDDRWFEFDFDRGDTFPFAIYPVPGGPPPEYSAKGDMTPVPNPNKPRIPSLAEVTAKYVVQRAESDPKYMELYRDQYQEAKKFIEDQPLRGKGIPVWPNMPIGKFQGLRPTRDFVDGTCGVIEEDAINDIGMRGSTFPEYPEPTGNPEQDEKNWAKYESSKSEKAKSVPLNMDGESEQQPLHVRYKKMLIEHEVPVSNIPSIIASLALEASKIGRLDSNGRAKLQDSIFRSFDDLISQVIIGNENMTRDERSLLVVAISGIGHRLFDFILEANKISDVSEMERIRNKTAWRKRLNEIRDSLLFTPDKSAVTRPLAIRDEMWEFFKSLIPELKSNIMVHVSPHAFIDQSRKCIGDLIDAYMNKVEEKFKDQHPNLRISEPKCVDAPINTMDGKTLDIINDLVDIVNGTSGEIQEEAEEILSKVYTFRQKLNAKKD